MVRVVFLHPDLGIGGAERLVVDAALALKSKDHEVEIVTAHHDSSHCFSETKDGQLKVTSVGDWLPRSVFGKMTALWATIRMIWAAFYISLNLNPEVIICDQVSNAIPVLKWTNKAKIIFYCHYPDQLLTQRKSFLKKLYRKPMDYIEEITTGMADLVLVNSQFTGKVFESTFKSLSKTKPAVLYPSLNTKMFDDLGRDLEKNRSENFTFLSINRYERKKNIGLAIEAFDLVLKWHGKDNIKLIIAGGYDDRVQENVEHFAELEKIAIENGISDCVTFLKSPSDAEKVRLLKTSQCLIYTPSGEHFGIVPIEAMYNELPVIAVNDGGPTETVVNGQTGFLCEPNPEAFADAMQKMIEGGDKLKVNLGKNGHNRVAQNFSFESFAQKLDILVKQVLE